MLFFISRVQLCRQRPSRGCVFLEQTPSRRVWLCCHKCFLFVYLPSFAPSPRNFATAVACSGSFVLSSFFPPSPTGVAPKGKVSLTLFSGSREKRGCDSSSMRNSLRLLYTVLVLCALAQACTHPLRDQTLTATTGTILSHTRSTGENCTWTISCASGFVDFVGDPKFGPNEFLFVQSDPENGFHRYFSGNSSETVVYTANLVKVMLIFNGTSASVPGNFVVWWRCDVNGLPSIQPFEPGVDWSFSVQESHNGTANPALARWPTNMDGSLNHTCPAGQTPLVTRAWGTPVRYCSINFFSLNRRLFSTSRAFEWNGTITPEEFSVRIRCPPVGGLLVNFRGSWLPAAEFDLKIRYECAIMNPDGSFYTPQPPATPAPTPSATTPIVGGTSPPTPAVTTAVPASGQGSTPQTTSVPGTEGSKTNITLVIAVPIAVTAVVIIVLLASVLIFKQRAKEKLLPHVKSEKTDPSIAKSEDKSDDSGQGLSSPTASASQSTATRSSAATGSSGTANPFQIGLQLPDEIIA